MDVQRSLEILHEYSKSHKLDHDIIFGEDLRNIDEKSTREFT